MGWKNYNKNRPLKDRIIDWLWDKAEMLVPVVAFIVVALAVIAFVAFILSIALAPTALVCYTIYSTVKMMVEGLQ